MCLCAQADEEDYYTQLKVLQRQVEFLDIQVCVRLCNNVVNPPTRHLNVPLCCTQEEYIKDEMRNLKRELIRAKEVCVCHSICDIDNDLDNFSLTFSKILFIF